jgi:hypothetical protein
VTISAAEVQKKVRALEQQAEAVSISRQQLLQGAIDSFPGVDPTQLAAAESAEERRERLLVSAAVRGTSKEHAGLSLCDSMSHSAMPCQVHHPDQAGL